MTEFHIEQAVCLVEVDQAVGNHLRQDAVADVCPSAPTLFGFAMVDGELNDGVRVGNEAGDGHPVMELCTDIKVGARPGEGVGEQRLEPGECGLVGCGETGSGSGDPLVEHHDATRAHQ